MQWIKLREKPDLLEPAAKWFSGHWNIDEEEYRSSMRCCILQQCGAPQWYAVLDDQGNLIAGAGVIENDFHDRKDLSPNVCALFVEEAYRGRGLAKELLELARRDMGDMGCEQLYLVTDHEHFYETCGWQFFTMVHDETTGEPERLYTVRTLR